MNFVKQTLILFLVFFILFSTYAFATDFMIHPKKRVGEITPKSTELELKKIYGVNNAKPFEVDVGEGDVVQGTIIYADTNKELTVEWKDRSINPERITIYRNDTVWKTASGITIGTTLEELEKINGSSFKISGFEWDYLGRTVSWGKGILPIQLQLDLDSDIKLTDKEIVQVSGDGYFSSKNQIIRKMKLKVVRIHIVWE